MTRSALSDRHAVIELAQGLGETTAALYALSQAISGLAGLLEEQAGLEGAGALAAVRRELDKSETALGEAYERSLLILRELAGDA